MASEGGRAEDRARGGARPPPPGSFGIGLLRTLGLIAFVLALAMFVRVIFWPDSAYAFATGFPRSLVCLALGFFLGVFFFVWHPQTPALNMSWKKIALRFVGPAALVISLTLALDRIVLRQDERDFGFFEVLSLPNGWTSSPRAASLELGPCRGGVCEVLSRTDGTWAALRVTFDPGSGAIRGSVKLGALVATLECTRGARSVVLAAPGGT